MNAFLVNELIQRMAAKTAWAKNKRLEGLLFPFKRMAKLSPMNR